MATRLRIKYVRSAIGNHFTQKRTIRALGLRRLGDVVEQADSPAIRGMVFKVRHLLQVEEVQG